MSSTSINEMEKKFAKFWFGVWLSLSPLCRGKKKEEPQRFACLDDRELDNLVEEAQAKSTNYSTKYAVNVFQANFCI